MKYTVLFALLILVLAGCGQATTEVAPATQSAVEQVVAVVAEEPAASPTEPATATAVSATAAPPPTVTPAVAEPTVEPTSVWRNPTATPDPSIPVAPPPPSGSVVQPPYAESACSDKYPCNDDVDGWLARIQVPPGFSVDYYGRVEGNPTVINFGPDELLYIATMSGTIYRMGEDGLPRTYVGGYTTPTGMAFHPVTGRLYVTSRAVEDNAEGESVISIVNGGRILEDLPCCYTFYHAANAIAFGPDGYGYVGVGGRADHGEILGTNEQAELHPYEAAILRFNEDGSEVEVYARGFRNPYGIAWDGNGDLWVTDNAPDYGPVEELHRVVPGAEHGYPWYDCPVCFQPPPGVEVLPPDYTFVPHASPTGLRAYTSGVWPGYYNTLFVTLWSAFPGAQSIVAINPNGEQYDFSLGYAAPIDVTIGPDGSLFVADWATGIIFRISLVVE
jgi:glucose/arabinose dehydrogenase